MNRFRTDVYEPGSLGYRQPVTSEVLGPKMASLQEFLLRAVLRGKHTREYTREVSMATTYSSALLHAYHAHTLAQLDAVRSNSPNKTLHVSFYEAKDTTTPPDVNIQRDRLYGQITLRPSAVFNKVPTYTDAFGDIRPRRTTTITRDGVALDPDTHPLYWALNGRPDRFWIDDSATADQQTIIEVSLPKGIRSEVNRFTVNPFPHQACTISRLEYRSPSGYRLVPGFLESANPIRTHFVPGQFEDQFRITLRATTIQVADESRALWGLNTIGAALVDYEESGTAYSSVSAIGSDTISRITSFSGDFTVDSTVPTSRHSSPPVEFTLQTTDNVVVYNSVTHKYPLTTSNAPIVVAGSPTTLWLKTELREPLDRVTPVVRNVTFTYE